MTEMMEIQAENPTFHVLFIPGNPGVVSFYKDFLESLYEFLGGNASVIGMAALLFEFDFFESLRWKLFISEFEFVLLISNGGVVCFICVAIGQISHTSKVR
jgi:hypothetical protein